MPPEAGSKKSGAYRTVRSAWRIAPTPGAPAHGGKGDDSRENAHDEDRPTNGKKRNQSFDTDVAIVGRRPGRDTPGGAPRPSGHRVTVVEKWPESYDQPRAVTFDHEIARILSILGIDSDNDPAIDFHNELYYWKNPAGENLLVVDWASTSASGWRVRYWFNQPELEKRLRDVAASHPRSCACCAAGKRSRCPRTARA